MVFFVLFCFVFTIRPLTCFEHPKSELHSHLPQPWGGSTSYHMPKFEQIQNIVYQWNRRGLGLCCLPYIQAKIHYKVDGQLFAVVIDQQKIDINLAPRARLHGMTLDSGAIHSALVLPV